MCGIAGLWSWSEPDSGRTLIKKMTDAIAHRGPNGEGFWHSEDETLWFGHRRLAIIDLTERAKQPLEYLNRYVITYNGEIYNYIEIREFLKSKGYRFNSSSDTEVILAAYDHWGIECLQQFDGMFALAIFDKKTGELFCARDRFGEKPFYYAINADRLVFASEMKALWAAGVVKDPHPHSMFIYLNFNLHENPEDLSQTFFKGIYSLKRGHYFLLKKDRPVIQKEYWVIDPKKQNLKISFEEACIHFSELLHTSVKRRLRSDVPVGTSLSGGLDSSSIVTVMNEILKDTRNPQKTFSARFNDPVLDEGYYMELVGRGKNLIQHFTYPDASKLIEELPKIMHHQEEPFASASIFAQWEVFRLAKEKDVIVLLDGQGADEVIGGYTHFFKPFFRDLFREKRRIEFNKAIRQYQNNNLDDDPFMNSLSFRVETKHAAFFRKLRASKQKLLGTTPCIHIHPNLYAEFKNMSAPFPYFPDLNSSLFYHTFISGLGKLLRFSDRNAMAFSREVRLPFLSHELVEFVFNLPPEFKIREGWTKALLRFSLKDQLPEEISWRKRKLGFQPPQKKWEDEPAWKEFAGNYQAKAVKGQWVNPKAEISWNGVMAGLFIESC